MDYVCFTKQYSFDLLWNHLKDKEAPCYKLEWSSKVLFLITTDFHKSWFENTFRSQQLSTFFKIRCAGEWVFSWRAAIFKIVKEKTQGRSSRAQFTILYTPWRRLKTLFLHVTLFVSHHITYRNRHSWVFPLLRVSLPWFSNSTVRDSGRNLNKPVLVQKS